MSRIAWSGAGSNRRPSAFSGGLASPGVSTTGHLTRPYDVRAVQGVQDQLHLSTAVVSTVLASPAVSLHSLQAMMLPSAIAECQHG